MTAPQTPSDPDGPAAAPSEASASRAPRYTHDAAPTSRLDACVTFYRDVASMRLVRLRGTEGNRVAWMAPADVDRPIFVFVEELGLADLPPHPEPLLRHIGFEVDSRADLDALYARLLAAGLAPTKPQFVDDVVGHVSLVHDPDGRVVEFSFGQDVSPASWD